MVANRQTANTQAQEKKVTYTTYPHDIFRNDLFKRKNVSPRTGEKKTEGEKSESIVTAKIVACFIAEQTFGYHKDSDSISLSQIMEGCGIADERTVRTALNWLEKEGYLLITPVLGKPHSLALRSRMQALTPVPQPLSTNERGQALHPLQALGGVPPTTVGRGQADNPSQPLGPTKETFKDNVKEIDSNFESSEPPPSQKNVEEKTPPPPPFKPQSMAPLPAIIEQLTNDLTHDLGDESENAKANRTRMAKIYYAIIAWCPRNTDEDIYQFFRERKYMVMQYTNIRHHNKAGQPNRMPAYFDRVLRDLQAKLQPTVEELIALRDGAYLPVL